MASPILWLALALLVAASLVRSPEARRALSAAGWGVFAPFWGSMALFFHGYTGGVEARVDAVDGTLSLVMVFFCLFVMAKILRGGSPALWKLTRATAFVGLVYFPFTEIAPLRAALIGFTDQLTVGALGLFGVPASFSPPYLWVHTTNPTILPDGIPIVEIILACTAVESIALFGGVILAVGENRRRQFLAAAATLPAIYLLNLIRNMFVTAAYAYSWYGTAEESFETAHAAMAKVGSTLALIALAYILFRILPETAEFVREVVGEFLPGFRRKARPGGG
ncbi:MAG: archaeosortase A [Halobacteria archaeon]